MASSKWKTFNELKELTKLRKYIFWGASNWIERTLEDLGNKPEYIVDKNKLNHGIDYVGYTVYPPSHIDLDEKPFIVISTVNYMSVIDELETMGYIMGEDYCCTPLLNERKAKDDLFNVNQSVLVSSSQHHADEASGGGLYKVNLNPYSVEKVYVGKGRGIAYHDSRYYLIDMLRGIVVLDEEFNEVEVIEIAKNSEPHGLCVDVKRGWVFVGLPGRDSVAAYDIKTRGLVKEYFISKKWSHNKKDNHHVNDPHVFGDSLYISMFSFSGNWLNEVYDGGILEIDLLNDEIVGEVWRDLWMPHSVSRVNGKITVLNSMNGELWSASYGLLGKIDGFARGLDYDGKYFYIGCTQHRYPEKLTGISQNVGMNTGFHIFDPETKMSRFINMDNAESIHSILLYQK